MENGISVVICCYNSEATIGRVLEHLTRQTGTEGFPWEVVVVDNASTDRTAVVARDAWDRDGVGLRVVFEGEPGLSSARRKGLAEARFPVIVFVDDDNLLCDEYIALAHRIMTLHPDVGLAGGLGVPLVSMDLPGWFKANESAYAVGPQGEVAGYPPASRSYIHGAGIIMRKEAWEKLISCGFEFLLSGRKGKSLSSGEDSELTYAFRLAGHALWYDPDLRFEHIIPDNRLEWKYLVKLAKEFGKAAVILDLYGLQLHNPTGWDRLKVRFWLIRFGISTYNLIKTIPPYLALRARYREGNHSEFSFRYRTGYSMQLLQIAAKHSLIRKEIAGLQERLTR